MIILDLLYSSYTHLWEFIVLTFYKMLSWFFKPRWGEAAKPTTPTSASQETVGTTSTSQSEIGPTTTSLGDKLDDISKSAHERMELHIKVVKDICKDLTFSILFENARDPTRTACTLDFGSNGPFYNVEEFKTIPEDQKLQVVNYIFEKLKKEKDIEVFQSSYTVTVKWNLAKK